MSAIKQQERSPKAVHHRQLRVGKWIESLKTSDVNQMNSPIFAKTKGYYPKPNAHLNDLHKR